MPYIPRTSFSKIELISFFAVLMLLVFFLLRPFVSAILASFVLAYLFYPMYKFIKKYLKNSTFAAFIVSFIIVLIFTVPVVFVANSISNEARINYVFLKQILATGEILQGDCNDEGFLCKISNEMEEYITDPQIKFQLTNIISRSTQFLLDRVGNFIFSIPTLLINFFVMVFIVFYLLKEGNVILFRIRQLLPMTVAHRKSIFDQLNSVTQAVVYGHILTAGIQAALGIIAFAIFGINAPILWGMVMFFFALIPFLGTPVVWVPAVLFKFFSNHPWQAFGLLVAGLIISTIDNIIKPMIVSDKARVHPVLVLLGVLGGLSLFGIIGVIIGPVILAIFVTFIEIYEAEKRETKC